MKANCREVIENLYQLIDGELPDPKSRVLESHIEICSECLRRLNIEREFKAFVRRRCSGESAPESLKQVIRDRLRAELEGS